MFLVTIKNIYYCYKNLYNYTVHVLIGCLFSHFLRFKETRDRLTMCDIYLVLFCVGNRKLPLCACVTCQEVWENLKVLPHSFTLSLLVVAKVKLQENARLHFFKSHKTNSTMQKYCQRDFI